jgi:ADP-ribosyl-[dinitrogen reductase] hydrolase
MNEPPGMLWWIDTLVKIAREIEGDNRIVPRGGPLDGQWSGSLWQFVEDVVSKHADDAVFEAGEVWYFGAYLLETVPTALHTLMRHCEDPGSQHPVGERHERQGYHRSVVGAAVGALRYEQLPDRWTGAYT